jgi:hypothetical protein
MSRTYSPDEMATPRDPSREPEKTNPASLVTRTAKTRAGVAVQKIKLARARRKMFKNEMLVP